MNAGSTLYWTLSKQHTHSLQEPEQGGGRKIRNWGSRDEGGGQKQEDTNAPKARIDMVKTAALEDCSDSPGTLKARSPAWELLQ